MGLIIVQFHVQYAKQPSSSFDLDCAHCCSAMFYFLVQFKFVLHLGAEPGKFGYHFPNNKVHCMYNIMINYN